ncbi:MAG TPA: hypothetical protein VKH35_09700, partial [Thermoanaerobaculia bacterium]|nr:hypothetical protein [Thermoanaerobaculia bacterium]
GRLYAVEQPDHITVFDLTSGTPVAAASFEEPVQAIAASGTSLFVSGAVFDSHGVAGNSGTPLRVFDLSDPASPHLASEFQDLAGPVSGVATDGSLAWVADRPFFRIFDVSTTASPREVSSLRIDDMGDRVLVQGTRAIVYGRGDVHLIDISNPYAPHLLKVFVSHGGPPSGAAFARTTIIEGNGYSGFHVLDFDREGDPLQIGGLKGHYSDAAADGDTAWVTYFGSTTVAVDLSDPTNPRPVSQLPLGGVRSLVVPATAAHPELLFVQALDGVHLLSLANKLHPVETAYIPSSDITAIAADGDTGYVAGSGFVRRLDLAGFGTAPAAMHVVAPMQMAAAAGKVVIADRYSLRVYGPDTAPPPPPTFRRHAASR